jgi:hypothetical protein
MLLGMLVYKMRQDQSLPKADPKVGLLGQVQQSTMYRMYDSNDADDVAAKTVGESKTYTSSQWSAWEKWEQDQSGKSYSKAHVGEE